VEEEPPAELKPNPNPNPNPNCGGGATCGTEGGVLDQMERKHATT